MKIYELPINELKEAPWNPNQADDVMLNRLKESLTRYGIVTPLVTRKLGSFYEVLSGNQRLKIIREMEFKTAPCVIVDLNDSEAMLLAQALNGLHGEDDLAMKGSLLKKILTNIPEGEVLSLLPETADSLRTLSSFSQSDMAEHLQAWEQAQAARLRHMQLQFTDRQLETVEEAVNRILPKAKDTSFDNPNNRGNAMYLLCLFYLEGRMKEINCPICSNPLSITVAKGRKSNKPFIMLKCNTDGRHFRGFITDQVYVNKVLIDLNAGKTGTEDG